MTDIRITYQDEWRGKAWAPHLPGRPAWFVTCPVHPLLGHDPSGEPWGYASERTARQVASRHRRAKHAS